MWFQVPGVPRDSRRDRSSDLISKTRSAPTWFRSCGEVSVVATMRAPWEGGLDQVVRTIFSIWESTRCTLSSSFPTTVRFPTRSSVDKPREMSNWSYTLLQSRLLTALTKLSPSLFYSPPCHLAAPGGPTPSWQHPSNGRF
uniref:Uncharacterized protein n=1 Tax=Phasianus colchicus TaxID=9054 RepID=A0A669QDI2_PHACC